MLIPIPNIIVFQYNPETMTRTLEPWSPLERQRTPRHTGSLNSNSAYRRANKSTASAFRSFREFQFDTRARRCRRAGRTRLASDRDDRRCRGSDLSDGDAVLSAGTGSDRWITQCIRERVGRRRRDFSVSREPGATSYRVAMFPSSFSSGGRGSCRFASPRSRLKSSSTRRCFIRSARESRSV